MDSQWETIFREWLHSIGEVDAAHGVTHIERVVQNARGLAAQCGADLDVVLPAAWLHDCVSVAKDSPLRSQASRLAGERASVFLSEQGYDEGLIAPIRHAIEAHSFSAEISPTTLEAQVVQDADRLDSLGAIGVIRCIQTGTALNRTLYDSNEPFPVKRPADDNVSTIDHFYTKLLKLADTMQTDVGRKEAHRRTDFLRHFLDQLKSELEGESVA